MLTNQPVFNDTDFDSESGIGDIVFDLAWALKNDSGLLIANGLVASLPTATEDALDSDRYTKASWSLFLSALQIKRAAVIIRPST